MNILIVEPSKIYQVALEKIFLDYATNIFISATGDEAKNIYNCVSIDLVCLSFYLADMDGITFVRDIRKLKWGETLPILMITSNKNQGVTLRNLSLGVTEVFHKDHLKTVEQYLRTYAQHARQQASLAGQILLIDSDLQQVGEICSYFSDSHLEFVHFTNAEAAADMVRAAEFDLVITNVVLHGSMSGMTLIREIREINDTMYRVPILAITEGANVSQIIELLRAGVNDSVQKPILMKELSVRVKNLLHNKKLFDTIELQNRQLEELAVRDQLTGLYNRHQLFRIVDRVLEEAFRYRYPVSLLVIDIDHFKKINDSFGHLSGDKVLKAIGKLLMDTFRGSDTPVRFGGEEFLVLLPHCDGEDAIARAQSLRLQVSTLMPISIRVTISIGISEMDPHAQPNFDAMFAAADEGLYAAKESGRNCVAFRSPVFGRRPTYERKCDK